MKIINKSILHNFPFEAIIWLTGIFILAMIEIENAAHFTVCPFALAGIDFCPGCGLGRSIAYLFELNLSASFNSHPLGIPALMILSYRCVYLIRNSIKNNNHNWRISNG